MIIRSHRLLSDERLARLAGEGNDAAFAALHRRYDALLHGYARSIARDADDAADALQNTWIAALIALRADRRRAPVRPWLFRIAHNAAIDVLRRRSAAVRPIDRGFLAAVPGVDEEYARSEAMAEVVGDMRELPTNQRAALVMRELADLDYTEIAIALSTSEGNARQLVFAARDGLRESRDGRALPCEAVRGVLARADGRELRRRRFRAHLSSCQGCRAYADAVVRPTRKVAGWAPAPALLQSIFAAAGGSGAAVTQGGSFAGLAKGAVAAALVVAGVGTGEYVAHQGGSDGKAPSAEEVERSGLLTGRAVDVAAPAPTVRAKAPQATRPASNRTSVGPAVIATASSKAAPEVVAVATTSNASTRSRTTTPTTPTRETPTTSPGSRTAPGAVEPAQREPDPHIGGRYAGSDPAGPRGAREARGARDGDGAARDCEPQAADSSTADSSRRERMPNLR